jgi:hypothetical protein
MTRSKQESMATIKLLNLATKRDSVFKAFSFGQGSVINPILKEKRRFSSALLVAAMPRWGPIERQVPAACRIRMSFDHGTRGTADQLTAESCARANINACVPLRPYPWASTAR